MTEVAHTRPDLRSLFQDWKNRLDGGDLATADEIGVAEPDQIPFLQQLINEALADRAAELDATLTAAFDDPDATVTDPTSRAKGEPVPPDIQGYTFLKLLGHGGMGDVWHVKDVLDQEFALKVAHRDKLSEAGLQRFVAEARTMNKVSHDHIVHVNHFGWSESTPFFLMPIYSASLKDKLAEYQADTKKAVRLMAAVAKAVGHLHARGYVHRDLKPGNVLLNDKGEPAVSDFGLVKIVSDDPSAVESASGESVTGETKPTGARRSRTIVGAVMGTKAYMAPEQAAGLTHLANPKWDVFALGVMLHELLTGQLPQSSKAPEKLLDPNEPDNELAVTLKPGLDPKLVKIIAKCLARDEGERYRDGVELAKAIRTGGTQSTFVRSTVALALLTVSVVAYSWPISNSPEMPTIPTVESELSAGRPFTIVGESGLPGYSNAIVGNEFLKPYLEQANGQFAIESSRRVLVDLLDDAGMDDYTIKATVRQFSHSASSRVYIYCGRFGASNRTGPVYLCPSVEINVRSVNAEIHECNWNLLWNVVEPGARNIANAVEAGPRGKLAINADVEGISQFHVQVSSDAFGTTWKIDNSVLGILPWKVDATTQFQLKKCGDLNPGTSIVFGPRRPFGVGVVSCGASFKNVVISPKGS